MLSTFALLTQASKVSKGSGTPNKAPCGDMPFEELVGVAKKKKAGLYAANLKAAVREVLGTAQSMGLTIDGKPAKQVQDEIKAGAYDAQLKED
jgi:large subunit ribosomal protein L11